VLSFAPPNSPLNQSTTAPQQAQEAVSEAAPAAREISNENYGQMAEDAETAYASMTLDAENACGGFLRRVPRQRGFRASSTVQIADSAG